jgi:hypothetical protein
MTPTDSRDYLDENLRASGCRLRESALPSAETLSRCLTVLEKSPARPWRLAIMKYRKPMLFSSLSVAAGLALVVGVFRPHAEPRIHAELVTRTLARQSEQNPLLDVQIRNLVLEELRLEGDFKIGSSGMAGDIRATIQEAEGTLDIDIAVGFGGESGEWVLIRKLTIPDAEARAFLGLFMPPGQETLLLLPRDSEIGREIGRGIREGLSEFRSSELISVFKDIIQSHAEYGLTVTPQADGTQMLTIPLCDEEVLEGLAAKLEDLPGINVSARKSLGTKGRREEKSSAATEKDKGAAEKKVVGRKGVTPADPELADAVLNVLYDPATESVTLLQISGFGDAKGTITLRLLEGEMDPSLLDPKRVSKPGTRTIDVSAFQSLIEGFKAQLKE